MNTMHLALPLAALLGWWPSPTFAPPQAGDPGFESAAALQRLIDPAPPGSEQASNNELIDAIRDLVERNEGDRIRLFGESAGPALRTITSETDLSSIARDDEANPLYYLVAYAPLEALAYFVELQATQPLRYETMVRGDYGPGFILDGPATQPPHDDAFRELIDRTLASKTLDLESKLRLAAGALTPGLRTEASLALIRAHPGRAVDHSPSAVVDFLVPAGTAPPADLDPKVAIRLLIARPEVQVYESLLESPHPEVRSALASNIESDWYESQVPPNRAIEMLTSLVGDPDPKVAARALKPLQIVLEVHSTHFDFATLEQLTSTLASKPPLKYKLCASLARTIRESIRVGAGGSPEEIGQLYATVFGAPAPMLQKVLLEAGLPPLELEEAMAVFEAVAPTSQAARALALEALELVTTSLEALSPERSEAFFRVVSNPAMTETNIRAYIEAVTHTSASNAEVLNGNPARRLALRALPSRYAADAARFAVAVQGRYDDMFFPGCSSWTGAGPEFRGLLDDPSEPARVRLLAGGALASSGTATDRDLAGFRDLVIAQLDRPSGVEDLDWYFGNRGALRPDVYSKAWNGVSAVLLEASRFPDTYADDLSLIGPLESAEDLALARRVLVAAETRAERNSALGFRRLAHYGLESMAANPELLQPTLLRRWLADPDGFTSRAVNAVLATGDPAWISKASKLLIERLGLENSDFGRLAVADQLLRLPSEEPVQMLLDYSLHAGSPELVTHVEQRVAELIRIRQASVQWSRLASGGTDLDGAKARVLELLNSPRPDVRLEAIRGLGTLGAVEALPMLIELVGSDSVEEKAAAQETLEMLRRRAAQQLDPTTAASPPK